MKLPKVIAGILLILAVVLAIAAWMMSRQAPRQVVQPNAPQASNSVNQASAGRESQQFTAVIASQAIPAGYKLTAADIKVENRSEASAGTFSSTDELIGKTTLVALNEGQPVLEQHLVAGLSLQLESGQRAVSIAIKEPMAAGNHIRPGDFVDVFLTLEEDDKKVKVDTQTRLLLARSRVLAYGPSTVENPPPTIAQRKAEQVKENNSLSGQRASQREEARGRTEAANTAVLAIALEDVQRLTLAEKYGHLNLALRHPDDMAIPDANLFAELPLALQPVGLNHSQIAEISAVDKAYAGLRLKDLSEGGNKKLPSVKSSNGLRQVNRKPSATPAPKPAGETIELHHGSNMQTVSY